MECIDGAVSSFSTVPLTGLGAILRVEACLMALVALEMICNRPEEDPYPPLLKTFADISSLPSLFCDSLSHVQQDAEITLSPLEGIARTADLFEAAWTHYDQKTYDHSVELVERRLTNSGFDRKFFSGKRCFDGGCGTGRLSIAMAKAGAKEVVAADIGGESLEYFRNVSTRYDASAIKIVEQDVTNLTGFPSDCFDFVASNGVLHHTSAPARGIVEHFRITRPGGVFWIYLYGAGGIYWDAYDALRPLLRNLEPRAIRNILESFQIRRGLIYTFLDNLLAPRVYYRLEEVLDLLRSCATFDYRNAKGMSPIDDTDQLLASRWGSEIFGPDGEVRIAVTKTSPSKL